MRRRLPSTCLLALAVLVAPSGVTFAGHPAAYQGQFDLTIIDEQFISPTELLVLGALKGQETILGQFTGEVAYLVNPTTGTYTGLATKTGTDGDRLDQTLTGHFTATGGEGSFKVAGGTGRFRNATGSGTFVNTWTNAEMTVGHVTFQGSLSLDREGNFQAGGTVYFSNVQGGTQAGGVAPYFAAGLGSPIGGHVQFGSILNLSGLIPVNSSTLIFYGEVGPNPFLPGNPKVHVIDTRDGLIYCTWTALFTLKVVNGRGDAVFSGDGSFTVIGGTGRYKGASGTFTTTFDTFPVPAGADQAIAEYQQSGEIARH